MGENSQKNQLNGPIIVNSVVPKNRQELIKWNGWGYNDSKFVIKGGSEVYFSGRRYPIGEQRLPHIYGWVKDVFDVDLSTAVPKKFNDLPDEKAYPNLNVTPEILEKISHFNISFSTKVIDRVIRAHGQTLHEIYTLQNSVFPRIPDVVIWPTCHEDVVKIVNFCHENNIVIIPYGGGTAVSGAPECPPDEQRTIVSLDTSQMNRILWLDKENLVGCFESGIVGQDLERELKVLGFTTGHEPDSYEFSSLGGWIATRASGMKKNVYGNIEDLLVHVKMVTPRGTLEKSCQAPRLSCGPDFNHLVLGSEGSLGVITEVVLKIRPLPKCQKYGSIVFPSFEKGVEFMREVAKRRWQPASIRLMDNDQFKFALILKPESSYFAHALDAIKKFYVTTIKGFDPNRMCVMTLLFEADEKQVETNEKNLYDLCKTFGGFPAGETNGERGYMLTFVIAYIRDLGLQFEVVAESFETSCPWDRAVTLVRNVKHVVADECRLLGITRFLINCRVTQTYDAGCVIYFYLAFNHRNVGDPVRLHGRLETRAREEIVSSGGSVSHHHGVGKLRRKWYGSTVSEAGVGLYMAAKRQLDPKNIFATDNLVTQAKL
ncbi:unnamed protein product [Phyllotreta striolata]|uniref:Alkylglycerone-phosphate synthase n=1 Tax=Phyllotreta striolata TaxID=444603 RepID=A0A9N9TQR3_PHYSR|nr:unnamed protein product [Phyllotreta striolata]